MTKVKVPFDSGRSLFAISKIACTPFSAICELIDNSITAKAKNIHLLFLRETSKYIDNYKVNIRSYLIIDDGLGMSESAILNALQLGSSAEFFEESSLSKFGLGLKSAPFSQGDELELISGTDGAFNKFLVSLPAVQDKGKYFAVKIPLTETDEENIAKYLHDGHGTIVKIGKVRKELHPSIKYTVDELKKKVGVIYYYFIKDDGVNIFIETRRRSCCFFCFYLQKIEWVWLYEQHPDLFAKAMVYQKRRIYLDAKRKPGKINSTRQD